MEKISPIPQSEGGSEKSKNPSAETINFHAISEKRKELRKAILELGKEIMALEANPKSPEGVIYTKHYKQALEDAQKTARAFTISELGGITNAKEALTRQKAAYEEELLAASAGIDYDTIAKLDARIIAVKESVEEIARLKDFRMRRIFEMMSPSASQSAKKRNEDVLETVREEMQDLEKGIEKEDLLVVRQAEILEYKENLAESGHICITTSVKKDLEAVGERMLTGKPVFLHGPTGTGKTSLARYAAMHFTGKTPEMVYCSPQTKESNVWGKTGVRPAQGGAIETVEIFGPLAKAMTEGKAVIFDEFTALPKEQMAFIKGVFSSKVGDKVNVVGNGLVEIKPGFQMIFTANLKSEKNPERQDMPPEIKSEFEQNNLEIKYVPTEEAYDIMLSRLVGSDGSMNMSFSDLNTTLPNLCKAIADIQESYTNATNKKVAERAGAVDASGKVYSLKDFVMGQRSIEAILSSWAIEKMTKKGEMTFAEFVDQRLKTALTFKAYPKEDRILAAKILASKGFLLTLSAQELDLPEDIFKFNTIKAMRGDEAVKELQKKSGDVERLTLKKVAELDPFKVREARMRERAEALLGADEGEKDPFLADHRKKLNALFGKEPLPQYQEELQASYTRPDGTKETITFNLDKSIQEFTKLYTDTGIDIPDDFAQTIQDIWERNQSEIQQAIEQNGFDDILIIPPTPNLPELSEKMKMENGYILEVDFKQGGGFTGAKSNNVEKPRILLVHNTQNLKDRPELAQTLNTFGKDVKQEEALTLEDYIIFQRKYFEKYQKHLDEDGWTWLATKAGTRLVSSYWAPGNHKLGVCAFGLDYRFSFLGVRPTRCFT